MLLRDLTPDILPPQAALLRHDVVLLVLPQGARVDDPGPAGRRGLLPPYGTVDVDGPGGPLRFAAARLSPDLPDPALTAGRVDVAELADGLDAAAGRRLLGFLLGFCRTAFRLGADRPFIDTCLRLARSWAVDGGGAEPVGLASSGWTIVSGMQGLGDCSLYVIGETRIRHSAAPALPGDARLHLVEAVQPGETLLALRDPPMLWTVRGPATGLPDVLRAGAPGRLRAAALTALAPASSKAAAALREMQVLAPAAARRHDNPDHPLGAALEIVLPDGEGGLFLRGWVRDPLHLIAGAELRTPVAAAAIGPSQMYRVRRPDLTRQLQKAAFRDGDTRLGFVAHVPDPSAGRCAQPSLALRLGSGQVIEVTAALRHLPPADARNAVLSAVPPEEVTPAMLDLCLAPAAAALHRASLASRGCPVVVRIGAAARDPAVSILVPLYRNLDFIRFQVAALAADPQCAAAELVYVLDSPEQHHEVEHLLRGLHALHGLAFTLAVMPANLGYAAANNMAAGLARGAVLLLLNSDVVPARAGWLGRMRTALAVPGIGAVGPKLLFDDGSIQHAGLFFERDGEGTWFNAHYHKGMPRLWPAAQRRRRVPGVTGACLMVRRATFEKVGGICEDYIIGDYEDSDFCLRVRATGAAIAYVPDAELFHFERRSITLHAGYARTLAALYNRRLHHRRWDAAMTALMATPPRARGGRAA